MLTKTDLEQIKKIVYSVIKETTRSFALKDDLKSLVTKKELNQLRADFKQMKEDIVIFKDEILHEIVDLRDDITVTVGYRDLIEDHEQRITKLEKTPQL